MSPCLTLSRHSLRQLRPVALACCALVGLAVGGLAMAQKERRRDQAQQGAAGVDLAATLQACSYDGSPLAFSPPTCQGHKASNIYTPRSEAISIDALFGSGKWGFCVIQMQKR